MGKRHFIIMVESGAVITLDDAVIDVVDDEWRESLYYLNTPEDIAGMVGYNMLVRRARLSQLDGWADQPDDFAEFAIQPEHEVRTVTEVSCEALAELRKQLGTGG